MKIVFTGGGTGGHFYPIIAIAEKVNQIIDRDKIVQAKLYYFSDDPYDKAALFDNGITFKQIPAGKMRVYFSVQNFFDMFKTFTGVVKAVFALFAIFPDVVVGKGGYSSFPTLLAARILGIPVVIHESDSYPGRVNVWAGKFARRVAVSFQEAAQYLEYAVSQDGGHWKARQYLGYCYVQLGRGREAIPLFEQVLSVNPDPGLKQWVDGLKAQTQCKS
jgi:UDP-N-acetylglucosamine--N-acetylmuramyl-(pentapeptide) pyrophosphoryl-undecaprenol N-acetylglucosamine transferase